MKLVMIVQVTFPWREPYLIVYYVPGTVSVQTAKKTRKKSLLPRENRQVNKTIALLF